MKELSTETKKENKQHINIFLAVITTVFLSQYIFEAGISVGKMFYRLTQ